MVKAKDAGGGGFRDWAALVVALIILVFVFGLWGVLKLGGWAVGVPVSNNPFGAVIQLFMGKLALSPVMIGVLVAGGVALALLGAGVGWFFTRSAREKTRVDYAARHMSGAKDYATLGEREAVKAAQRLGVAQKGLTLGKALGGGSLYSSWEYVMVDIWGPRTGKTTARAVPMVLEAPGAVVATSNKADLLEAAGVARTRLLPGSRLWVFDPQAIAHAQPSWYWNPLTFVTNTGTARELAQIFVDAARPAGGKQDAFFDTEGPALLTGLLVAAAKDGRTLTDVYRWLSNPNDTTPIEVLQEHGELMLAADLTEKANAPDKQRGGVYATAKQGMLWLADKDAATWAIPSGGEVFRPDDFVRSNDSIFILSKEGAASSAPLTTALTVAITRAAENYAESCGGRLPTPMVLVLDEAANVVRWRNLPSMYSHYGSRGIVATTILQSWAQGEEVWGREGMAKLWSAANIRIYGGGVSEVDFLDRLRQIIGRYDQATSSVSYGEGRRTVQASHRTLDVLDVAELAALPLGRALVMASGSKPVLMEPVPYYEGPHADLIASVKGVRQW